MTVTKEQIKQAKETLEQLEKEYDKQSSPFEYLEKYTHVCIGRKSYGWLGRSDGFCDESEEANEFAKAIQTMIDLRLCEGVKGFDYGERNYYILNGGDGDMSKIDCIGLFNDSASPYFETREHALAAIETIGEERINHMFKTLSGME